MLSSTKNLIFNVIQFSDEVDEKGNLLPRSSYKKEHLKGALEIKRKINEQIEVPFVPKDKKEEELKEEDVVWIPSKAVMDVTEGEKYNLKEMRQIRNGGRYKNESDLELSEKAKQALKYNYKDREELPDSITEEALEELEIYLK